MSEGSNFRKSRHSFANGNCVEVGNGWRKAKASHVSGNCVEAASGAATIAVRDTADRSGPVLRFSPRAWAAFTAGLAGAGR